MDARLLDMFHDPANQHALAVTYTVDVDFRRQIQEAVEQYRAGIRHAYRGIHVGGEVFLAVHHLHRPATEDIRRSDDERETHVRRHPQRFFLAARRAVRRLLQVQRLHELLETLAVLGQVDRVR